MFKNFRLKVLDYNYRVGAFLCKSVFSEFFVLIYNDYNVNDLLDIHSKFSLGRYEISIYYIYNKRLVLLTNMYIHNKIDDIDYLDLNIKTKKVCWRKSKNKDHDLDLRYHIDAYRRFNKSHQFNSKMVLFVSKYNGKYPKFKHHLKKIFLKLYVNG